MTEQFANFSQSSLAAPITALQNLIAIADPITFPPIGNFRIVVQSFDVTTQIPTSQPEIMIVTAVSEKNFSVIRGAESTTAIAFASGAQVTHIVTAGVMEELSAGGGGVTSVNGETGVVVITSNDDSVTITDTVGQIDLSVSASGITIGQTVTGGNPNDVLFIDPFGNLAQDENFTYDKTTSVFSVAFDALETNFTLDAGNQVINAYTNGMSLLLDGLNEQYAIGDINTHGNGGQLYIDNANRLTRIIFYGNAFLSIDNNNLLYTLGDENGAQNGNSIQINDSTGNFSYNNNAGTFLAANPGAATYQFGDAGFTNGGTSVIMDDNARKITFQTDNLFQIIGATSGYQVFVADQSAGPPIISSCDVGFNFNGTRWITDDTVQQIFGITGGSFYILDLNGNNNFNVDVVAQETTFSTHLVSNQPAGSATSTSSGTLVPGSNDTSGTVVGLIAANSLTITFGLKYTSNPKGFGTTNNSAIIVNKLSALTTSYTFQFSPPLTGDLDYFFIQ